jgi:hypothetical protein
LNRLTHGRFWSNSVASLVWAAVILLFVSSRSASAQSLPIFYDPVMASKGFPNPFVKARIAGQTAIFIIDTGASVNLLAAWYVEAARLPTAAMPGSTVNGSVIPRMTRRLQGRWSNGRRFSWNGTMVVAFPPYFESNRIGGIVSPQFLTPAGMAAVLDLAAPSLRFLPFSHALADLQKSNPSAAPVPVYQACHSKTADPLYVVPATAAGVTDLMGIDTGATNTQFSADSNIAHVIGGRSERAGHVAESLGGVDSAERVVRNVQLLRGGRTVTLNPAIGKLPAGFCNGKGLLGMDALRGCLLILSHGESAFSCARAPQSAASVTGR